MTRGLRGLSITAAVFLVIQMTRSSSPAWAGALGMDGGNMVVIGVSSGSYGASGTGGSAPDQGAGSSAREGDGYGYGGTNEAAASPALSGSPGGVSSFTSGGASAAAGLQVLPEQASNEIVLPAPVIYTSPPSSTYVNLPTWLWIDPADWRPFVATASAGAVSATATAEPSSVTWSMGDGSSVVCTGPGVPYDFSVPASEQQTDCSYTYTRSSAGQPGVDGPADVFRVTATINWVVTWSAAGTPGGGDLPQLSTTSTQFLRVEQVESVRIAS